MSWRSLLFIVYLFVLLSLQFTVAEETDLELIHIFEKGLHKNTKFFRVKHILESRRKFRKNRFFHKRSRDGELILVPDPKDKTTILNLADMSSNGYEDYRNSTNWKEIPGFNLTEPFGWDGNGLQGHIFGNSDRSLLVMAIKGTTFKFFGDGGTSEKDKYMDNLMFSCCCASVDSSWDPVCGCHRGSEGQVCNSTCLCNQMRAPDTYYDTSQDIYLELRQRYPTSAIWFTGHSLGGALASLLAVTNKLPSFTYEAPGELLYAQRVGLKIDPDMTSHHIFHYGNDADPIFEGTCQGRFSTCYQFGYALETKCHVGHTCTYQGGFLPNINHHRLQVAIDRYYTKLPVPECIPQTNCFDCGLWQFDGTC